MTCEGSVLKGKFTEMPVIMPLSVKGEALTPDSNPGPLAHQRRALPLGYSHQRRELEKVWNHTPSARAQGYKLDGTEESWHDTQELRDGNCSQTHIPTFKFQVMQLEKKYIILTLS
jgi:hypothetical protein